MNKNNLKPLKILPIGGLGEIGLNCMVFEYDDEIIVVDCGILFSDLQMLGVDLILPDMTYLQENKEKIAGYVITHAHEDHIGALSFAMQTHPAPIYCTTFAQKLIQAKFNEVNLEDFKDFRVFAPYEEICFKHFRIQAVPVNHSIVEAMALFIESPVGRIIFTGDFKFDSNPFYGKPFDRDSFKKAGDDGVLLLMSDSTNVEREGFSLSEQNIYGELESIFQQTQGLTIVAVFASNIARIGQVFELAQKLGKKIAVLGRSMEQNIRHAFESGYLKNMREVLVSIDAMQSIPRQQMILLSTGSQGEYRSALFRIAYDDHADISLEKGDTVVMSSKFIPGNEKAIGRMINALFMRGAKVLYEAISDIHVSGHANAAELREMILLTRPKFFLPIHGEYRHLVQHAELADKTAILTGHSLIAVNGDVLELTSEEFKLVDHFEENRIFIEGAGRKDVSKIVIRDRRKVAETGVVFAMLVRNSKTGEILGGPDILSKGVLESAIGEETLLKEAKNVVLGVLKALPQAQVPHIQEEIRIHLRRYYLGALGQKPVVLPIVIDL